MTAPSDNKKRPPSTLTGLCWGFFLLGATSVGGVLPHARRILVDSRKWLTEEEFDELLGLSQFIPGGNVINVCVAVGAMYFGAIGATLGILSLLCVPTVCVIVLALCYQQIIHYEAAHYFFNGLAAATVGLLLTVSYRMVAPHLRSLPSILIIIITIVAIVVAHVSLLIVMPVMIVISWLASHVLPSAVSRRTK